MGIKGIIHPEGAPKSATELLRIGQMAGAMAGQLSNSLLAMRHVAGPVLQEPSAPDVDTTPAPGYFPAADHLGTQIISSQLTRPVEAVSTDAVQEDMPQDPDAAQEAMAADATRKLAKIYQGMEAEANA